MRISIALLVLLAAGALAAAPANAATLTPFTGAGGDAAALAPSVGAFRTALGGSLNAAGPTTTATGRREISWDGAPNGPLAADFFNTTSPNGVVLSTPGSGLTVFTPSGGLATFSAPRLFTPAGSTVTDVELRQPGTPTAALVSGFGAVFSGVDTAGEATLEYFGRDGAPLGTVTAPAGSALSFAGATVAGDGIARVRITSGTAAGTGTPDVALDDLVYGEPHDAASTVQLAQAAYAVHEKDGVLGVTVRRTGIAGAGSVRVLAVPDTAEEGDDFGPLDTVVSFAPGEAERTVSVPVVFDRAGREGDEVFTVALDAPVGPVLGAPARATVTLHNDRRPGARPDRTAPKLVVRGVRRTLSRKRFLTGVGARVVTDEAASLDVRLLATARRAVVSRAGDLILAHRRLAAARGTRAVRLRPSRALVGTARRFTVRLRVEASDVVGNRGTVTRTIRVR